MVPRARIHLWTRRGILLWPAQALLGDSLRVVPDERRRYPDPATEFEVVRLTDPHYSSYLPSAYNRAFSRRGNVLLYSSDRGGNLQAYAMDLRNWQSRQLTEAAALDGRSLTLTPDDRSICYLDGNTLMLASLATSRAREVCRLAPGPVTGRGMSITLDGPSALVVEGGKRLSMVNLARGAKSTVADSAEEISDPVPRPRRASVLYRGEAGSMWLAHLDGRRNYRLTPAAGGTGPALWSPDGRTILYLHYPVERNRLHGLRELNPDTGEDRLIAPTTQFVQFSVNSDASVYVGASGSKASPYVLLLLRAARRELTLCEHKANDPALVTTVFSPDSQRVFFQSDRHGKPALYVMAVEKLVEKTDS